MVKFNQRSVINLKQEYAKITGGYVNFVVNTVNESCLRLAVFEGEYRWHFHPDSDELFIVLEGELIIDFEDSVTAILHPFEMLTVPKCVIHRTRASGRTVNLCFEHTQAETVFVELESDKAGMEKQS